MMLAITYLVLLYTKVLNKLVGDDQARLGENVTAHDLLVLVATGYSV